MILMPNLWNTLQHLFHPQRSNNHRPKILHHSAYVYFTALAVVFMGAVQSLHFAPDSLRHVLGFSSSITASEVIAKTNQERAKSGLEPLVLNEALTEAALAKGQNMMSDQYWAHISPSGIEPWHFIDQAGYEYTVAGENLARDFVEANSMMEAWMQSPTHRANILNTRYKEIGIAVIDGTLLGYDTTLVVQMFGKAKVDTLAVGSNAGGNLDKAQANEFNEFTQLVVPPIGITQANQANAGSGVLAGVSIPGGELSRPALFTPLQLSKAFFLALILVIIATLLYDSFVIGNRKTARMVGKNLAHLVYFSAVAYLVVFFKAGLVG